MKCFINLVVYVMLSTMTAGCLKGAMSGKGSVPDNFLGVNNTNALTLDDDSSNQLFWNTAVDKVVVGNVLNPVINGTCGNVLQVELWVNGSIKKTATCNSGRFQMSLSGANAFINGIHNLKFMTLPSSSTLERTYNVFSIAPSALLTIDNLPNTTISNSIHFSLRCHSALRLTIGDLTVDCENSDVKTQVIALDIGINSFSVKWIDFYRNSGEQTFSIVRNLPGSAEITAGMISATESDEITLTNCAGSCDGSKLANVTILGFETGVTLQNIPLSHTLSIGGGGETISVGNHSNIFCENRNIAGECIP